MDKQQILEIAKNDPRFSQAVLALEDQIGDMPITTEGLDEIVQMLEFALNNPDKYQEVLKAAIDDDLLDPGDLPEQFDPVVIISMLVLMYGMQERTKQKGFARGGLASIAARGRLGDTMLAHINPREAEMLKRMGGSGTINPQTGLPEYKFSLKKLVAIALPIAIDYFVPGLGSAIGAQMGLTGTAAAIAGGAVIGGGTAALTGGDPLKGAVLGGLGSGAGDYLGSAANTQFGLGLDTAGKNLLGNSLIGGAAGMASGQGFVKGAATGALGTYAGQQLGGLTGNASIGAGAKQFGNMITAGYDPKSAIIGGGLTGLATAMSRPVESRSMSSKPSDAVIESLKLPKSTDYSLTPADYSLVNPVAPVAPEGYGAQETNMGIKMRGQSPLDQIKTSGTPVSSSPFTLKNAVLGATLLSSLSEAPSQVQQAVKQMSPEQQEYFNRPSVTWDWNKMQNDANAAGLSLDRFMASNWPRITGYASSTPDARQGAYNQPAPIGKARGGALSAVARFAQGAGSGRADTIDAKLSDGEYVIDAETVAMLGDGSNQEGAKLLDAMRQNIRSHKGKALAKGKFSPNAKSPLAYLKGVA
jgi:hypothetical protein